MHSSFSKIPGKTLGALLAVSLLFLWTGVLPARAETLGFSVSNAAPAGAPSERPEIDVRDDETLEPILDARVSVSESVSAASERSPTPSRTITVTRTGYASVTLAGVTQAQVTIYLKPLEARDSGQGLAPVRPDSVASGTLGDYQVEPSASRVRAGFVFRNLSVFDLLHFNPDSLISPVSDTIDVFGSHKIPSNLVFPYQRITFVTVDKPSFRLPVQNSKERVLLGIQGEMSVWDLLKIGIGGKKSSAALLNFLDFTRIGVSQPFSPAGDLQLDIPAITDLIPAHEVSVSPPPYEAEVMVAALTDLQNDRRFLVPTDIKVASASRWGGLQPVEVKSTAHPLSGSRALLTLAMGPKAKRLSGILLKRPGRKVRVGKFLQAEEPRNFHELPARISLSPSRNGVSTVVFESYYRPTGARHPVSFPVWYVYALPAAGKITIPTADAPVASPIQGYSLSHLEFGKAFRESEIDGKAILRELSRFTRSESHSDTL